MKSKMEVEREVRESRLICEEEGCKKKAMKGGIYCDTHFKRREKFNKERIQALKDTGIKVNADRRIKCYLQLSN